MDYLTAWREGHEAGMQLVLKIINELTGQEFQKSSEVVLYIKQLEADEDFYLQLPTQEETKTDELSKKQEKFIDEIAERTALENWMWS